MQNTRVNIFTFPHKGLKNGLCQLLYATGKADIDSQKDISVVKKLGLEIIGLLHLHQDAEDACVMRPLAERAPSSVGKCHDEHDMLQRQITEIQERIVLLEAGISPRALEKLFIDLGTFFSDYIKHMNDEETTLNEAIWSHFTDEEILEWQASIMSKLTFPQTLTWFKYIIPALNPNERQILIGGFKTSAPEKDMAEVSAMLRKFLNKDELTSLLA